MVELYFNCRKVGLGKCEAEYVTVRRFSLRFGTVFEETEDRTYLLTCVRERTCFKEYKTLKNFEQLWTTFNEEIQSTKNVYFDFEEVVWHYLTLILYDLISDLKKSKVEIF